MSTYMYLGCKKCGVQTKVIGKDYGDGSAGIFMDGKFAEEIRRFLLRHRGHELIFANEYYFREEEGPFSGKEADNGREGQVRQGGETGHTTDGQEAEAEGTGDGYSEGGSGEHVYA